MVDQDEERSKPVLQPLSREVLVERRRCCGCGCLNCPYVPRHVKGVEHTDDVDG